MRFVPQAYVSFFLTLVLFALCLGEAPVFGDPDTAWHLAAGDLIRSLHAIPPYDTWAFTTRWEPWYNLSWLYDILTSLLFQAAGFPALYALTLLTFAGCLVFMADQCIKRGASIIAVFPATVLAMLVMYIGVLARPNMCSVALSIAFYQFLHRFRTSGRWQDLAPLPPLMALWVNLHGGFLLAFVIMGVFLVEAMVQQDYKRSLYYRAAIAACLAATLLNPYGFALYYGAYKSIAGNFDNNFILEWKPVEIGRHLPMTAWLILMLWVGNASDKRIPLCDRLLAAVMFVLSLMSVRHSILGVLLMLPYVSLRLSAALREGRWGGRVQGMEEAVMRDMQEPLVRVQAFGMALATALAVGTEYPRVMILFMPYLGLRFAGALYNSKFARGMLHLPAIAAPKVSARTLLVDALVVLLLVGTIPVVRELKEPSGFPQKSFPVEEAAWVEEHYPHLRFLTDYDMGGYLDYLWRGRVKVFVDGRASSLFSDDVLDDYAAFMDASGNGAPAEMIMNYYRLDGLILLNSNKNAPAFFWSGNWKVAHRGAVATVYLRRKGLGSGG